MKKHENMKNEKKQNMINKMMSEMMKKWRWNNDKKMMNAMITKIIKFKNIFWPGPVCGCKFFITVEQSSTGKCLVQALHYKVIPEVPCASFVVQSSTGKCLVQAL